MHLQYEDFEKIMDIGIRLSTEKDRNRLLMTILDNVMQAPCICMSMTNCALSS